MAHHLQDLPPLEGQASLLAGDGTVLPRVVVEKGTHEYLDGKGCSERTLLYKGVGHTMTAAIRSEKTHAVPRVESWLETPYVCFLVFFLPGGCSSQEIHG